MKIIVRLQAWARGARVRRAIPNFTNKESMSKYRQADGYGPSNSHNTGNGKIEDRPEFQFKNGARYLGQWMGNDRHGRGV